MSTEQFVIIGNGSSVNKAPTLDLCWILLAFVIHNRLYRHNQCSLNSLDVVDVARSIDNINSTWYKAECVERDGTATEGRDEWAKSGRVAKSIIANWRLDLITPLVSPLLDKYKITGPVDHVNIAAKSNSHLLPPIAPPPRNGNLFLIFLPTQCSAALKKKIAFKYRPSRPEWMTFREPYGVGDIHLGMSRICEYMHNLSLFETVLIHTITGTYAQQRRWCGIYRIRMTRRDQIWDSAHGDCNARALFHPMASAEREKKKDFYRFLSPLMDVFGFNTRSSIY